MVFQKSYFMKFVINIGKNQDSDQHANPAYSDIESEWILTRSLSALVFPHNLTNEDKTTIEPTPKAITAFDLAGIHRDNTNGSGRSR